jgi:NTE family protein
VTTSKSDVVAGDETKATTPDQPRIKTQDELKIRHVQKLEYETVLVMQGGGSLGAYECGVYKALSRNGIKFDIVAGTSIGAVNAAIIAGSRKEHPDLELEQFWMEVAENTTASIIPDGLRAIASSTIGAFYGNPRVFSPRWLGWSAPYLYDLNVLKRTLERYVDFTKLNANNVPRVILTCTTAKP